jgi:hypothetical protein
MKKQVFASGQICRRANVELIGPHDGTEILIRVWINQLSHFTTD